MAPKSRGRRKQLMFKNDVFFGGKRKKCRQKESGEDECTGVYVQYSVITS